MKSRFLIAVVLALVFQAGVKADQVPSDVRVQPFISSKWDWNGGDVDGAPCYNYYNPVLASSGANAPVAHAAMAIAQILHYYKLTTDVSPITATCGVDTEVGSQTVSAAKISLKMQGGTYDWSKMPDDPSAGVTDEERQEIGKLTSDVGIALRTAFNAERSYVSSLIIQSVLKEVFGFANVSMHETNKEVDAGFADYANYPVLNEFVFANLDAGYPVILDIRNGVENEVHDIDQMDVALVDGYGFEGEKPYVHVVGGPKAGWRAVESFYNICGCFFNLFPTDADRTILAGRAVSAAGDPVANAGVKIYEAGSSNVVANATTSDAGVFAVRLPSGKKYEVSFVGDGLPVDRLGTYELTTPTTYLRSGSDLYGEYIVMEKTEDDDAWTEEFKVFRQAKTGNRWGDIALPRASVRISSGGKSVIYGSVETAVAAAKALVKKGATEVALELLDDVAFAKSVTIAFPCTIARAPDAKVSPVTIRRTDNASLRVMSGGSLTLHDVSFSAGDQSVVDVEAGGVLKLGAHVDFNMPSSVPSVQVAEANGFVLADRLTSAFALGCDAAGSVGETFGSATCSQADAEACAVLIANSMLGDGAIRGAVDASGGALALVWTADADVPLEAAAGYFADTDGNTVTSASLNDLFEKLEAAKKAGTVGASCEIVVRDRTDLTLTRTMTLSGDVTIRGESADGVAIAELGSAAGFVIPAGATLTVKNLVFDGAADGYGGNSLFLVNGGSLTSENVSFSNLTGTNSCSPAIAVLSGSATVVSNEITSCRTGRAAATYGGGGIFVGANASLALTDSTISNCWASICGGGVYAKAGATVALSGNVVVTDNTSGYSEDYGGEDNVYLTDSAKSPATLEVTGVVSGRVGVLWRQTAGESANMGEGATFATASSAAVATGSAAAFANDADASLAGSASGTSLVWAAAEAESKQVEQSRAAVSLTPARGAVRYYATIADAVSEITEADGDVILDLLQNTSVSDTVTISSAVTLRASSGTKTVVRKRAWYSSWVYSDGRFVVVGGGSLTLAGVTLDADAIATAFLEVQSGGSLTLQSGTTVANVAASRSFNEGAIYVNNGTFTMESGSRIADCENTGRDETLGAFIGGAIRARNKSTVYLKGGVIERCHAYRGGGGVAITEESTVYVSGDLTVVNNENRLPGGRDNLLVSADSKLYLAGNLTGKVGCMPGTSSDANVFGYVDSSFLGSNAALASSAANFSNDVTGDIGFAVKSGSSTLLVWSDALDVNGQVTIDGKVYSPASTTSAIADVTTARLSQTYTGFPQTCVYEGHGFVVDCTPQTTAGVYTATATLKRGFTWADGSTAPRTVDWTIEKAKYEMNLVTFEDKTFDFKDGETYSIAVDGSLPSGVSVTYVNNDKKAAGTYTVTARFSGDEDNYEKIPDMTAKMIIKKPGVTDDDSGDTPEPEPEPEPEPQPVDPSPIAFQSITKATAGDGTVSWQLVVTNRVKYCSYRLLSTDDLAKGFTTTGAWEEASIDGAWTNNVTTTAEKFFWRAEAKGGTKK